MTGHELDRAGIRHPQLREAYQRCRRLNAEHGRTYFLATRMLSPAQRPAVHALYGFARWVDDIVDDLDPDHGAQARCAELDELDSALRDGLAGRQRTQPILGAQPILGTHPALAALVDTAERYGLETRLFTDFMASMRMDLSVTDYPTRADLDTYVHGSAGVIGLQVLPVLGSVSDQAEAAPYAAALGQAFQITNFLRDVGEDLQRGRVYLPADELAAFGVDRDRLMWCRRTGRPDRNVRQALADQVGRNQDVYRRAEPGIALLAPVSRPCVSTAFVLYREILDRVVESGYDVFRGRLAISKTRRIAVAAPTWFAASTARARTRLAWR